VDSVEQLDSIFQTLPDHFDRSLLFPASLYNHGRLRIRFLCHLLSAFCGVCRLCFPLPLLTIATGGSPTRNHHSGTMHSFGLSQFSRNRFASWQIAIAVSSE
jgi:hypothetical protein